MGRGLLILVGGLVIIVGMVQMSISKRLKVLPERNVDYHQEMDAQNISNSLMNYGIEELNNNQNWQDGFSSSDFMGAEVSLSVFTCNDYLNDAPASRPIIISKTGMNIHCCWQVQSKPIEHGLLQKFTLPKTHFRNTPTLQIQ